MRLIASGGPVSVTSLAFTASATVPLPARTQSSAERVIESVTIGAAGGPTEDKPGVTVEPPSDPDRVSGFLNIRVADIHSMYELWSARGAEFLTPPIDRGVEIRCYMRDPDRRLIEVGQLVGRPDA